MATDAEELGRMINSSDMWSWAFTAIARLNGESWEKIGTDVLSGWKAVIRLEGADCKGGTMAAAMWMGRAIVRLACKHRLLGLDDVPGHVQTDCGVEATEVIHPTPPADGGDGAKGSGVGDEQGTGDKSGQDSDKAPKPKPKEKEDKRKSGRKKATAKVVNMDEFGGQLKKQEAGGNTDDNAGEETESTPHGLSRFARPDFAPQSKEDTGETPTTLWVRGLLNLAHASQLRVVSQVVS